MSAQDSSFPLRHSLSFSLLVIGLSCSSGSASPSLEASGPGAAGPELGAGAEPAEPALSANGAEPGDADPSAVAAGDAPASVPESVPVNMLVGPDAPATGGDGDAPAPGSDGDTPTTGSDGDTPASCEEGRAGARFVDSEAGDDAADGLAPTTAWRTLARVNAEPLQPGDSLCFRAGGSWTGQLAPLGSGAPDAPIVIDRYGDGPLPKIAGGTSDLQAVLLVNQQHIEINHLELTNDHAGPGDYRGISVRGRDAGELNHVAIRDCFIHDVTGEVNWIGGSIADDEPPWVKFQTGWDASKRTGGIVFEIESVSGTKTWFNDVVIERNVIQDTSFGGIIFKQLEGSVGWGVRSSRTDARFTPHTNISIRGNFLSQTNTPWGCNTIYVTGSQNVVIEGNVAQDSGTSAIEVYNTDNVLIQRNETFGTVRKAGGADFNGIDADRASTRTTIQYNYIHDNGDGLLLCQFAFGDSIARYNLIVNSSRYGINLHSDAAATNQTYNNLVYSDLGGGSLVSTSGNGEHLASPYVLSNNIFFATRAGDAVATGSGVRYASNLYSGLSPASGDASARSGDPLFADASSRASGGAEGPAFESLVGFRLRAGSPAVGAGVAIADNGGVDFWNTPLYVGAPDVGPFEAPE